jgi:hypothetical protein
MSDNIKVFKTPHSFPNSPLPAGYVNFGAHLVELHMVNCKKNDPSLIFVADNTANSENLRVRIEIPISELNKALAELGYTLDQP